VLQHIVPHHYLKGFCDPQPSKRQGPVVWEFRLKGDGVVRQRSPKNVGRIRDYYSVPIDGVMDPAIEGGLSTIESGAAPVIAKLRGGNFTVGEEERQWLAAFIALQMVRGPAHRDHVQAFIAMVGTNWLRAMGRRPEALGQLLREVPGIKDEDRTPARVQELARMAAEPEKHFKITATPHSSLPAMTVLPDLMPPILTLRWEILVAGAREHFVTRTTR
jgi:uncharacterized protein DUF4238